MHRILLTLALITVVHLTTAQTKQEITTERTETNSHSLNTENEDTAIEKSGGSKATISADKLERIRKAIESKGGKMTVNKPGEEKKVHPFIARWTGKQLPYFKIKDINGQVIDSKEFAGKIVHINFWSTSCRPCIEEFAEMNALKEKYGSDLLYIAIAPESAESVKKILKKFPLDYTVIADAEELFDQLGIEGYPKNFFIDQDQVISKVTDGTNYKMEKVDEKLKLIPDNFRYYDEILAGMTK